MGTSIFPDQRASAAAASLPVSAAAKYPVLAPAIPAPAALYPEAYEAVTVHQFPEATGPAASETRVQAVQENPARDLPAEVPAERSGQFPDESKLAELRGEQKVLEGGSFGETPASLRQAENAREAESF